jgi:hypothetical protein
MVCPLSSSLLQVLYEKLAKYEDIKVNAEIGAIAMKSAGIWIVLDSLKLLAHYCCYPDFSIGKLHVDYDNCRIGFINEQFGFTSYLIGKKTSPSSDIMLLNGHSLKLNNLDTCLGVVVNPPGCAFDNASELSKYVEFTPNTYSLGYEHYDQELNKIASGWLFKRVLKVAKIENVYIFNGIFVYVAHRDVKVDGNDIKIGDEPHIYSLYTNYFDRNSTDMGFLLSSDFKHQITLKLLKDY